MAIFKATKEGPSVEGESAAECQRVGQTLVEANQVTPEIYASALSQANGDLLAFADGLLARHGVGRTELALAISQATGVPAVDTKGIVIADELKAALDESVVRRNCVWPSLKRAPRSSFCAATRRRAVVKRSRPLPVGR